MGNRVRFFRNIFHRRMAVGAAFSLGLLGCSSESAPPTDTMREPTRAEARAALLGDAVAAIHVAIENSTASLADARFGEGNVAIRMDVSSVADGPHNPLTPLGIEAPDVAAELRKQFDYHFMARDEAMTCDQVSDLTHHPCRLNFEGLFYYPQLAMLSADSARVAVHFLSSHGSAGGTRIVNLARSGNVWKVASVENIAS